MSLSPLQCLEELAAGVEEVLEAPGDRVLPALGLVLAGLCEAGSTGMRTRAALEAQAKDLWALLVPPLPEMLPCCTHPIPMCHPNPLCHIDDTLGGHAVLQAHHDKCSAGGRSSPGPADGPELQPGLSVVEPGHHTPASLQGQGQCYPHATLAVGMPHPWYPNRTGSLPCYIL